MTVPHKVTDGDACDSPRASPRASYEELRLRVLEGSGRFSHVGRGVLLRQGMAGWMAWRPTSSATVISVTDSRSCAAPLVMDVLRSGVVGVLASMALATEVEMSP